MSPCIHMHRQREGGTDTTQEGSASRLKVVAWTLTPDINCFTPSFFCCPLEFTPVDSIRDRAGVWGTRRVPGASKQDKSDKCLQRAWHGKRDNDESDEDSSGHASPKPLCDAGKKRLTKGSAVGRHVGLLFRPKVSRHWTPGAVFHS